MKPELLKDKRTQEEKDIDLAMSAFVGYMERRDNFKAFEDVVKNG